MIGIILAAGNGVRLKDTTGKDICKALRKINNTHLIEFALNNLIELNINKAIIVVGKQGEQIKNTIGYDYKGVKITYASQTEQKGLINAFVQALDLIENEDVVLQLADEIFVNLKASEIKAIINEMKFDFYCGFTYEDDAEKIKGNFSVEIDENSLIKKCIEKPRVVTNNIKGTGFCVFKQNSVQTLKSIYNEENNTPNDLCDFLNYMISTDKKGLAFCLAEKEFNINTVSDMTAAEYYLK